MDDLLRSRLHAIQDQITDLEKVENEFLTLEAHKDVLFAELYRKTSPLGVNLSKPRTQADRESEVYSSQDWVVFSKSLAAQHALFNKERRIYELKLKAFDAEYLSFKVDTAAIKRGVGG